MNRCSLFALLTTLASTAAGAARAGETPAAAPADSLSQLVQAQLAAPPTPSPASDPPSVPASEQLPTPPGGSEVPAQPAATAPAKTAPRPQNGEARLPAANTVTVSASRPDDMGMRQQSTAAKMIFGREELDRNGDTSVVEVLKRLPGVTIGGRPGRGSDIRMRGMGGGYTQILINGERIPPGFSIETLSPDQIERIEIMRGPVAEYSTQAIAGTINIVLREDAGPLLQQRPQLRLSDSVENGRHAPNVSFSLPGGEAVGLAYLLSGNLYENRQLNASTTDLLGVDTNGQPNLIRNTVTASDSSNRGIQLTPRFSYHFAGPDTLVFQPFLVQSKSQTHSYNTMLQPLGTDAQPYASANSQAEADSSMARLNLNWTHREREGVKIELRANLGLNHSSSTSHGLQYDSDGVLRDRIDDTSNTKANNSTVSGKYSTPFGNGHTLAFGSDIESSRRTQTNTSTDNGVAQYPESGDSLNASSRRLAGFAQDEWDINKQWSTNLGLRWEGIKTTSSTLGDSSNISSVWSPVLHAVYRLPDSKKDQVRASLTRSYRAPSLADMIATPSLSRANSAVSPDRYGNPALQPELATGVELAFEHYLTRNGIFSANLFSRNISNLMRRETSFDSSLQRWVSRPINIDKAHATGIELEAKFQVTEFFPEAPAIDIRSNYSHFWSRVDGIYGANNRLEGQPKQTANLGFDYRLRSLPLTFGAGINYTPAYDVQTSNSASTSAGIKRQYDAYALWKLSPLTNLRLSASNLDANDFYSASQVILNGVNQRTDTLARTYTIWNLKLEMKL